VLDLKEEGLEWDDTGVIMSLVEPSCQRVRRIKKVEHEIVERIIHPAR
jgi:hypothetical protein